MSKITTRPEGRYTRDPDGTLHSAQDLEITYLIDDDTGARVELSRKYVATSPEDLKALFGEAAANAVSANAALEDQIAAERATAAAEKEALEARSRDAAIAAMSERAKAATEKEALETQLRDAAAAAADAMAKTAKIV